jgi:hypothetical protein
VVVLLERGAAQGGITDGWRHAAPAPAVSDVWAAVATTEEGGADHAATTEGGGPAGDAEGLGAYCWPY